MIVLTIVLVQTGPAAETAALRRAMPRIRRHLVEKGGFLGQAFGIEIWEETDRTEAASIALADRVRARPDIAAVVMWGGSWIGPASAEVQQVFVDRTTDLPFVYLSGSVLREHARHPGSFALPPAFRDKPTLLTHLTESFPANACVAWISKANDDPAQLNAVRTVCENRGLPFWHLQLPREFETTSPLDSDWDDLRERVAAAPSPTHWFIGAFALNHPLRAWLAKAHPAAEVVQLNTGKRPAWLSSPHLGGEIFFGSDGSSELPDLSLSRSLRLADAFPRIKLDELLLLQQGASLVPPLPPDASRQEVFERWLEGLRRIDGRHSVFVGTRTTIWFDPCTRSRISGTIVLKRRLAGRPEGLMHPLQLQTDARGSLARVPVAYVFIDLLSMDRVSVEDKDVELDFFLDIRSETPLALSDLRLLNAKPRTLVKQRITEHLESEHGRTMHVRRYRIVGVFSFDAAMQCYPADCQAIEISLAPSNPRELNILIQPPPRDCLDHNFDVAGWHVIDAEVSSHTMFWHSPTTAQFDLHYQPYGVISFRWLLRRRSKDTIAFVAVPMLVLIGLSFFAALSDLADHSAKVEELTTAMLATIALYFATPKPRSDDVTILDRAFRTAYILIGGLLATILTTVHFFPDAYLPATRAWAGVFPTVVCYELLVWRHMIRRQAEHFVRADDARDA